MLKLEGIRALCFAYCPHCESDKDHDFIIESAFIQRTGIMFMVRHVCGATFQLSLAYERFTTNFKGEVINAYK